MGFGLVLLFHTPAYLHGQSTNQISYKYSLDSLKGALNDEHSDSARLTTLDKLASYYRFSHNLNLDSLAKYTTLFVDLAGKTGKLGEVLRGHYLEAMLLKRQGNKEEGLDHMIQGLKKAEAKNDSALLFRAHVLMGDYHAPDIEQRVESYKKALAYGENSVSIEKQVELVILMANDLVWIQKEEEAFDLLLNTIEEQKENIGNTDFGFLYSTLGRIYRAAGEFEMSIESYNKAVEYHDWLLPEYRIEDYLHMGMSYQALGPPDHNQALIAYQKGERIAAAHGLQIQRCNLLLKTAIAFQDLEKYDQALAGYRRYFELKSTTGKSDKYRDYIYAFVYSKMGAIYVEQGNIQEAKRVAKESISLSEKSQEKGYGRSENLSRAYLTLYRIDSVKGDYKSALDYYRKYTHQQKLSRNYVDSLDYEEKVQTIKRLEVLHETKEKEKQIAELTYENELQQIKADSQENLRIWLVVVLLLLLILIWQLYRRFVSKKKSLAAKEMLIAEVHHRVKNNLQIILSLLNAQIDLNSESEDLAEALKESQNRIKSMAIIHQNLYNANNYTEVSTYAYLRELIGYISHSYRHLESKVRLETNIEDVRIKMELAVPLGLIINELITNSYKYAFDGTSADNQLLVDFSVLPESEGYKLEVRDNGIGLPANFSIDKLQSFGIQLVKGLVDQLHGRLEIHNVNGARFEIYMKNPAAA